MHRTPTHQTDFARGLRAGSTEAEAALWRRLRSRQLGGAKFRRQVVLGPYFADLVCVEARLVVECDGGQHAESTHDAVRDAWMCGQGWRVLRFWNHEVLQNTEGVLVVIAEALDSQRGGHSPSPQPSPCKGEGATPKAPTGQGNFPSPSQGEGTTPKAPTGQGNSPSSSQGEGATPKAPTGQGNSPSPSQGEGRGEGESPPPTPQRAAP